LGIEKTLHAMTDVAVMGASANGSVIRMAAAGDELACAQLVDEYYGPMVRAAFVIAGDTETAREAVQAAWTLAWRKLGKLREPESIRPWLVSIAANEARRIMRRQRRRTVVELSAGIDERAGVDPAGTIDLLDLGSALRGLDPDERSLLALRYVTGLDSTEIARLTGLSASGVRSRLARLLERLRGELDDA
jgi:RNA polymerase sigma-70 factor (ECF subfamily)